MPTALKIVIALVVIGGGFAVYFVLMGDAGVAADVPKQSVAATTKPTNEGSSLGPGVGAWVTQFDKNGRESYRFRADKYLPQRDGTFLVTAPTAEFFLKGQSDVRTRLRISGREGTVYVQQGTGQSTMKESAFKKENLSSDFGRPPRKGRLHDVTVQLIEGNAEDTPPSITLKMNNAAFDNETFRVFTESFKNEKGEEIPAEWVPVNVTGQYDFTGYGLTVRWNDLDQRLELLKVFHGEKLVIKDTSAFSGATPGQKKPASAKAGRRAPVTPPPVEDTAPVILAVDTAPTRPTPPATAPATASASPYRAKFTEQVVIKQGDQTLAQAEEMNVDFLLASGTAKQDEKKTGKGETPKPAKNTAAKAATPAATNDAVSPAPATAPTPTTAQSVAAATTQPSSEPITVYWHGPLEITPQTDSAAAQHGPALKAGEASVEFVGAPVILTHEGGEMQCASLVYRTADGGSVSVRNSDRFPRVLVKQPIAAKPGQPAGAPAIISTNALDYSAATHLATLGGPSSARIPLPSDNLKPGQAPDILEAEWSQGAKIVLLGDGGKDTSIDHADFTGDVHIKHPQLNLRAQQLQLAFAPGAAPKAAGREGEKPSPVLSSILATERVQCDVIAENTQKQTVLCDRLSLKTATGPDGRVFPQVIDADGQVRATDEKQELLAQHVTLMLAPGTKASAKPASGAAADAALASAEEKAGPLSAGGLGGGGVELRRMEARQNVLVRSAEGALAAGDELTIVSNGPDKTDTEVRLVGKPARIEDKDHNTITGPVVVVHPDTGKAEVEGAGTIDAVQKDEKDPKDPGRKVHVAWANGATVNGPEDLITVDGNVNATMPDRDGAMNTSHSQRVEISLVKKPVPGAATQPAAAAIKPTKSASIATTATKPTTNPTDAVAGRAHMDFFKDKQVGEVTLLDEAVINSRQVAADGSVLREFQMQASRIGFDLPRRKVNVPVGGQMLVRDHRPDEAAAAAKPGQPPQPGEGKGISAFQWSKSLSYDEQTREATMTGDVVVVHKPDGAAQLPVRLQADQVIASFLPTDAPKPAAAPAPKPGAAAAPDLTAALHLKQITATGHITITRDVAQVTAERIEYDPVSEWITATGTARNPASFRDGAGTGSTTAEVVQWNARTWHVKFKNVTAKVR